MEVWRQSFLYAGERGILYMEKRNFRKFAVRCFSVLLALLSILFGVTWKRSGVCFGDRILTGLGLPAWSKGAEGTHYSAVLGLILLLAAFLLFAVTTKERNRTFRLLIVGSIILAAVINFLAFAG